MGSGKHSRGSRDARIALEAKLQLKVRILSLVEVISTQETNFQRGMKVKDLKRKAEARRSGFKDAAWFELREEEQRSIIRSKRSKPTRSVSNSSHSVLSGRAPLIHHYLSALSQAPHQASYSDNETHCYFNEWRRQFCVASSAPFFRC